MPWNGNHLIIILLGQTAHKIRIINSNNYIEHLKVCNLYNLTNWIFKLFKKVKKSTGMLLTVPMK